MPVGIGYVATIEKCAGSASVWARAGIANANAARRAARLHRATRARPPAVDLKIRLRMRQRGGRLPEAPSPDRETSHAALESRKAVSTQKSGG